MWLTPEQRRVANQIRGAGYLDMFGLVEEFVLPFVLDHVRPQLNHDDYRVRAFLSFAAEEAKHIQLFRKFREEFDGGFGTACDMIGPPDAIGRKVLSHHPLAVSLAHPAYRMDDAASFPRQRAGRRDARSAVQEPAAPSLDGGGAARQARHADGGSNRRRVQREGARRGRSGLSRNRGFPRWRAGPAGRVGRRKLHEGDRPPPERRRTRHVCRDNAPGPALDLSRFRHEPSRIFSPPPTGCIPARRRS